MLKFSGNRDKLPFPMATLDTPTDNPSPNPRMMPPEGLEDFWSSFEWAPNSITGQTQEEPFCGVDVGLAHGGWDESIRLLDPIDTFDRKVGASVQQMPHIVSSYDNRINVLRDQAASDGYFINHESEVGFLEYFRSNPLIRRSRLVLLENGNLRAVWKGDDEAHVGLQFLGKQMIQYVIFKRRQPYFPVSRVTGIDNISGVRKQIHAFDLEDLVYA